jgi:hypothetical protein
MDAGKRITAMGSGIAAICRDLKSGLNGEKKETWIVIRGPKRRGIATFLNRKGRFLLWAGDGLWITGCLCLVASVLPGVPAWIGCVIVLLACMCKLVANAHTERYK